MGLFSKKTQEKQVDLSRQRHLLCENVRIEEEVLPSFVRPIMVGISVVLFLFLVWASITPIKEVARGSGQVIPSSKVKVVQHLDGGIIEKILVDDRQFVQEGDLLIKMDPKQVMNDMQQTQARLATLRMREERLVAFTEGGMPAFLDYVFEYPDQVQIQSDLFCQQVQTRASTLSILDKQIQQREQRLQQLRVAVGVAKRDLDLTSELSSMRQQLVDKKLITRSVMIDTQRAHVTSSGEVARLMEEVIVSTRELEESVSRRRDTANQIQQDSQAELSTVRGEIGEVEEALAQLKGRFSRLEVRAPNRGFVQDLQVHTIGQVVQPGGLLMQIVPDDVPLEAEVRVLPKDIGFMQEGQDVKMRVSSYDYSRFGYATGKVKTISPFSMKDETGAPYFKVWVILDKSYVGNNPQLYPLQPGMALEADIVLGEKTLLAYMIRPVTDVITKAFNER